MPWLDMRYSRENNETEVEFQIIHIFIIFFFFSRKAAEALGAIGQESSLELLEKYLDPEFEQERVVRETCELAIARIKHELHKKATGASDPDR